MKFLTKSILLFFIFLSISPVDADSYIYGAFYKCLDWNKMKKGDDELKDMDTYASGWIAGYMTAYSLYVEGEAFKGILSGTAKEYVVKYCDSHPDGDINDAFKEMMEKLK